MLMTVTACLDLYPAEISDCGPCFVLPVFQNLTPLKRSMSRSAAVETPSLASFKRRRQAVMDDRVNSVS